MSEERQNGINTQFTIVLPCFNESHRLALALPELFLWRSQFQKQNNCLVEIILANDGCTDDTPGLAKKLALAEENFTITGYSHNQGRGAVLRHTFPMASAHSLFVMYMDADLATDLKHLQELFDIFKVHTRPLVVCGNRYFPGSELKRPLLRKIWSWGWRSFVSLLFLKKFPDTQCGFKAFSPVLVKKVFSDLKIKGFVADVEIILRSWKVGAEVKNLDIKWIEKKGSTIRWSTVFKMFWDLFRLRFNASKWLSAIDTPQGHAHRP